MTSIPIINDGLAIQITATEYGPNTGFSTYSTAPYTVKTRLWSKMPFAAYSISELIIRSKGMIISRTAPNETVRLQARLNPHGLYMAQHDFKDFFDWAPAQDTDKATIEVNLKGSVIYKDKTEPFQVTERFIYKRSRATRLFTWADFLSL